MKNSPQQTVLEAVKSRTQGTQFGYGVTTADRYVRSIVDCGDRASVKRFGNVDASAVLKEAEQKLTYCDESMVFGDKFVSGNWKSQLPDNVFAKLDESVKSNVAMVFRNVITTNSEDRDRDVLHTEGAEPDLKMPFLWQHIHTLPIGKMLMIDEHTPDKLSAWTVLFDMNELTHDAAILIENDALRISHGFIPKQIKDRQWKKDDADERMPGFDIMKFVIMEESGVSVPSNTDAVIDLYASEKLKSPHAKSWAKEMHDGRVKVFNGLPESVVKGLAIIGEGVKSGGVILDLENESGEDSDEEETTTDTTEGGGETEESNADITIGKTVIGESTEYVGNGQVNFERTSPDGKTVRKGVYVEMKGSFEWIRSKLRKQVKDKMADIVASGDCSCYIEGTYSDHVVVEVYDWETSTDSYWEVSYEVNKNGEPGVSGIPVEVELSSSVNPKEKDAMKFSSSKQVAMKGMVRFLKSLSLTDSQKSELEVHGTALDELLAENKQPAIWKQTEGGEEENVNSGDGNENPGVESTADDDGNSQTDGSTADDESEAKSVTLQDVATFLASEEISDGQKATLQQILG